MGIPHTSPILLTPVSAIPAADAGGLLLFDKTVGGRHMLKQMGPAGQDTFLQPHVGRNSVWSWKPQGISNTVNADGPGAALSATGSAAAGTIAVTSLFAWMKHVEYQVTVAATTAVAGFRLVNAIFARGNVAKVGGFTFVCRWGPATGVATATNRAFVGLQASNSTPTDVQPSSLLNMVGMGWDAADTNIQMMSNDASGTATKTDLGASFPVPTVDKTSIYEIAMFCPPNGTDVKWTVTDLLTDVEVSGTLTTDLPVATTLLTVNSYMSVGGTSSVIGMALMGLYIETDY